MDNNIICGRGEDRVPVPSSIGFDSDWSKWEKRTHRDYTNLPSGDYTFRLKSKTITGLESEEVTYAFSVQKPWYTSAW
ncbi:MAG: hypothetical protein MZV63_08975 [Marinilabiliales bacterium]|nr:hypothetical protein [Marinilabiliales bacterium]